VRVRAVLPSKVSLLRGLAAARWACWAWSVGTVTLTRYDVRRPWLAALLLSTELVFNAAASLAITRRPGWLTNPVTVLGECAFGWLLLTADGWVFEHGHAFTTGQNLASAWPLIAVLSAAIALGPIAGVGLGVVVATGRFGGAWANGADDFGNGNLASLASTAVYFALAGGVAGWITRLLRRVELEVAATRAREDVARTLHDGVLQTLALVERRTSTSDPQLAAVARASDRDLRAWLFRGSADDPSGLAERLHAVCDRVAGMHDATVSVNVVDGDARVPEGTVAAVSGAVQEAVTNAAKHAPGARIVVFAEVDETGALFASVRDDGPGFDAEDVPAGRGMDRSVRARIEEQGGRVDIDSKVGEGTEVRMWLPARR
jgi:signal transduction histidine kinase